MAVSITVSFIFVFCLVLTSIHGNLTLEPSASTLLVKVGTPQTIVCSTEEDGNLSWDFNKQTGISTQNTYGPNTATLTIGNFTDALAGEYTCELRDDANGKLTETITLKAVEETKTEPSYHYGNSSVRLACTITVSGNVVMPGEWLKGDQPVANLPDNKRFVMNATDGSLTIADPTREDIGTYTAQIQVQDVESPYNCTVSLKDEIMQIAETKLEPLVFPDNSTAVLSCNISTGGRDIKSVHWLKNGTKVSDLEESKRFTEVSSNNSLIIDNPNYKDHGMYTARFVIDGAAEPHDCLVMLKAHPHVLEFKKSKNLIEKDNTELQCLVSGFPRAVVTWYKDEVLLNVTKGNDRIKQLPLFGYKNAKLVIKDVAFSDAGDYTCVAYSKYFNLSANQTVTVRVKDKLAALWPFLGIVCEVIVLCAIIFFYERRRNKQIEQDENNAQEADAPAVEKKDGVRHRNAAGNPSA